MLRSLLTRLPTPHTRGLYTQETLEQQAQQFIRCCLFSTKSIEDLLHNGDENDLRRFRLERKEKQDKKRYAKMLRRKGLLPEDEDIEEELELSSNDAHEKSLRLKAEEHNVLFHEPVMIEEVLHVLTMPKV